MSVAATDPQFLEQVQRLQIQSKLSSLAVAQTRGNAYYDSLPSPKDPPIEVEAQIVATTDAATALASFDAAVSVHKAKTMEKSAQDARLLTLTEEEARIRDQLSLFQLKCREAQLASKAQKEAHATRRESNDALLLKVQTDTLNSKNSILGQVETQENNIELKIKENADLAAKLVDFTAMLTKQTEHAEAVKRTLSLTAQLEAARDAERAHVLSSLQMEEENRQKQLAEQRQKIRDLEQMQKGYAEQCLASMENLKQNEE
jgi:hypothetical protein